MAGETHILVIPYPVQGHINPMLQLSKRLASKGLKVTLVTTTSISSKIQMEASSVQIECISDGSDEGGKGESPVTQTERFTARVSQGLAELIEKQSSSDYPAKVLVYDSAMPWALDLAQRLGLRGASFFTQSCAVTAIYYHFREGHFEIPLQGSLLSLPSLPLLDINDLPSFITDRASYPFVLALVLGQFNNFQMADWLLFNTFDKLEVEVVSWMASRWPMIKTIGPTIPSLYLDNRLEDDKDYGLSLFKTNAEACMKWLDTKEKFSIVYASFGSLASLSELQMEELAWGLKNSDSNFLWVVRASEESKLPCNFINETSKQGLLVNWCPQLEVLAHQAVGCFMTHCGWNSTIEALSLGVPIVAMPQWTDQTTNAKCIVDLWHAGVRLKVNDKGIVIREEIELNIKQVMEGEKGNEIRTNAAGWKDLAKEAVDEGGSSYKNIEEFVSELLRA